MSRHKEIFEWFRFDGENLWLSPLAVNLGIIFKVSFTVCSHVFVDTLSLHTKVGMPSWLQLRVFTVRFWKLFHVLSPATVRQKMHATIVICEPPTYTCLLKTLSQIVPKSFLQNFWKPGCLWFILQDNASNTARDSNSWYVDHAKTTLLRATDLQQYHVVKT